MNKLIKVIPNESWELAIQFGNGEYRLLKLSIPREEYGWSELAYPQHMKRFTVSENEIVWEFGGKLNAAYLYQNSDPVSSSDLERHSVRIGYKNQAPTAEDKRHHVYGVYLYPFREKIFSVGESIGGGHGDRGGSINFSLSELRAWDSWRTHFKLSGCDWAIDIIEKNKDQKDIVTSLLNKALKRNGV